MTSALAAPTRRPAAAAPVGWVAATLAGRSAPEVTAALWCAPDFRHLNAHALELVEVWAAIELDRLTPADITAVLATGGPRLTECHTAARHVLAAQ